MSVGTGGGEYAEGGEGGERKACLWHLPSAKKAMGKKECEKTPHRGGLGTIKLKAAERRVKREKQESSMLGTTLLEEGKSR